MGWLAKSDRLELIAVTSAAASASATASAILSDIVSVARQFYDKQLVEGTAGNVSALVAEGQVAITPSAMAYHQMQPQDLVRVDFEGEVISGQHQPSAETAMHLACYRAFPEVRSVLHCHPLYASMFAVARQPIPAAIEEVTIYIGGDIEVCDYAMTGTAELGQAVTAKLSNRSAALLANHGLICVGKSPQDALHSALVVERTAQIVWGARALGKTHDLPAKNKQDFAGVYSYIRDQTWSQPKP